MKPKVSAGCHQTLSLRWDLGTRLLYTLLKWEARLVAAVGRILEVWIQISLVPRLSPRANEKWKGKGRAW